jgi:hypothetical protein
MARPSVQLTLVMKLFDNGKKSSYREAREIDNIKLLLLFSSVIIPTFLRLYQRMFNWRLYEKKNCFLVCLPAETGCIRAVDLWCVCVCRPNIQVYTVNPR